MGEQYSIRKTAIPETIQAYIDKKLRKGANRTQVIVDLLDIGLKAKLHSGQEDSSSFLPVERGTNIDTHQKIKRHDKILIPCPITGRWMDKKVDCEEGCKLKCSLPKDMKLLWEGLVLHTRAS